MNLRIAAFLTLSLFAALVAAQSFQPPFQPQTLTYNGTATTSLGAPGQINTGDGPGYPPGGSSCVVHVDAGAGDLYLGFYGSQAAANAMTVPTYGTAGHLGTPVTSVRYAAGVYFALTVPGNAWFNYESTTSTVQFEIVCGMGS